MVTKEEINKLIDEYAESCGEHAWYYASKFEDFAEDLMKLVEKELEANDRALRAMSDTIIKAL